MAKSRNGDWGHPVGIRAAADWSMCPTLVAPAGVASFTCNQSTCMAVCEAGKVSTGRRRIKCRWKRKKGFFWRRVRTSRLESRAMKCQIHFITHRFHPFFDSFFFRLVGIFSRQLKLHLATRSMPRMHSRGSIIN